MNRPEPASSVGDGHGTIPAVLARRAREHGTSAAIAGPDGTLTYAELHAAARAVTRAAMAAGLRAGDRAAIWAPNSTRWIVTALGLLGAGATLVPVGTRLRGPEAADILARSRSRVLFTVRGFLDTDYPRLLAESGSALPDLETIVLLADTGATHQDETVVPIASWPGFLESGHRITEAEAELRCAAVTPDDIGDILFTSGTTGAPKGVPATQGQTLAVFEHWTTAVTLRHADRYLLVNPFSHTFGYKAGIIACLLRAACMVPVERFDARLVAEQIERHRITVLTGPPTLFGDLIRADRALPTVRLAGTGGARIPVTLVERIRDRLGIAHVFTAYGLTESIGVVSICPPDAPAELIATTVGQTLPGSEIRILDSAGNPVPIGENGEIAVRGPNVMHGYLDDPAATAAAIDPEGLLHTGDVGYLDECGYLHVTDRLKDMFIVGGFNAYPAEIERILLEHPGIEDVAVIGVPDARLGEAGAAFIVPAGPGADAEAILAWARNRMAGYKIPRHIYFVDSLPRNVAGKVRKTDLRAEYPAPDQSG
ncbi:acyl-CoA synthetase (AMP-forming)/AMP-acid ligase II [Nocardia sp. GAS34]|uniref:AMP-binding protein n=1 Tax=unclassified Nocardia TaxID=2637762 RepID=UPI003D204240